MISMLDSLWLLGCRFYPTVCPLCVILFVSSDEQSVNLSISVYFMAQVPIRVSSDNLWHQVQVSGSGIRVWDVT